MMFGGMGWMMVLPWVGVLALLATIAAVALLVARRRTAAGAVEASGDARELLDERYARGDIDDDEYFRRVSVLDSQASRPGLRGRSR